MKNYKSRGKEGEIKKGIEVEMDKGKVGMMLFLKYL